MVNAVFLWRKEAWMWDICSLLGYSLGLCRAEINEHKWFIVLSTLRNEMRCVLELFCIFCRMSYTEEEKDIHPPYSLTLLFIGIFVLIWCDYSAGSRAARYVCFTATLLSWFRDIVLSYTPYIHHTTYLSPFSIVHSLGLSLPLSIIHVCCINLLNDLTAKLPQT